MALKPRQKGIKRSLLGERQKESIPEKETARAWGITSWKKLPEKHKGFDFRSPFRLGALDGPKVPWRFLTC